MTSRRVVALAGVTRYVALYCRITIDRRGTVESVARQEKWGRAYAAKHWPDVPIRVFADNDLTAADEDVFRPGYEELRTAIAAGEVCHVWSVEQTRVERVETRWFALAALLDAAGVEELHTNRDGVVRVLDEAAGFNAVRAAGEVRRIKRRVNDALGEIAEAGRPHGSIVFGYAHTLDEAGRKTLSIVDEQAAVIREAADRVLSGWSVGRIVADLQARGLTSGRHRRIRNDEGEVTGRRPTAISARTVKSWLTNATIAGQRVHKGQIIGRGVWEPILDVKTWDAVRDRLTTPHTVERKGGRPQRITPTSTRARRRYLLTGGIARCGVCEAPLIAAHKTVSRGRDKPYYYCHPSVGGRACVAIGADEFEAEVVRRLMDELDKPEFLEALAADDHAARRDEVETELRALEVRRRELTRRWSHGKLTDDEWDVARAELGELEADQRAALAEIPPAPDGVDATLLREAWPAMNLDEQRHVVAMFVKRVAVHRAPCVRPSPSDERRVPPIEWVIRRS